jgi:hypothetical protein
VKPRGNNPLPFLINFYKYVPVISPDRQAPRRSESDGDLFVWLGHMRVGHPYISAFEGTRDPVTHTSKDSEPKFSFAKSICSALQCFAGHLVHSACKTPVEARLIG